MKSAEEIRESLRLNAVQVDKLALQYGSVRQRGLKAQFHRAVNLSIHLNQNFVLGPFSEHSIMLRLIRKTMFGRKFFPSSMYLTPALRGFPLELCNAG